MPFNGPPIGDNIGSGGTRECVARLASTILRYRCHATRLTRSIATTSTRSPRPLRTDMMQEKRAFNLPTAPWHASGNTRPHARLLLSGRVDRAQRVRPRTTTTSASASQGVRNQEFAHRRPQRVPRGIVTHTRLQKKIERHCAPCGSVSVCLSRVRVPLYARVDNGLSAWRDWTDRIGVDQGWRRDNVVRTLCRWRPTFRQVLRAA